MSTINDLRLDTLLVTSTAYLVTGDVYSISVTNLSLAAGASISYGFTVPSSFLYHQIYIQTTAEELTVATFEGGSISGGTVMTALNLNRNSSKQFPTDLLSGVTVDVPGTQILNTKVLGTSTGNRTYAAEGSRQVPMLLRIGEVYYVTITNNGGGSTTESSLEFQVVAKQP